MAFLQGFWFQIISPGPNMSDPQSRIPCEDCISNAESSWSTKWIGLCEHCSVFRKDWSESTLRDRSYRRHLTKQVAGIPCDSNCPEAPSTHATFQPPPSSMCIDSLPTTDHFKVYYLLSDLSFDEFRRMSYLEISSYGLLAAHHDGTDVWYCNNCYGAAVRGAEENSRIQICAICLERRNIHVNTVHKDRSSFYGEDAHLKRTNVLPGELEGRTQWNNNNDEWFENWTRFQVGGGSDGWTFDVLGAVYSLPQAWRAWQVKRHNDMMYEQGQTNIRNADRTHALELSKQWASLSDPQPSFQEVMQKFEELQAVVDAG